MLTLGTSRRKSAGGGWQIGYAAPDPVSDFADDAGVDEARDDAARRIWRNVQEILQTLECHGRFCSMNHVIHDRADDLCSASLFPAFDAHRPLRSLIKGKDSARNPFRCGTDAGGIYFGRMLVYADALYTPAYYGF